MRMVAAIALESGIDPRALLELEDGWLATMQDLLASRGGE